MLATLKSLSKKWQSACTRQGRKTDVVIRYTVARQGFVTDGTDWLVQRSKWSYSMSETSFVFHVIHASVPNDQVCFPVFPCPCLYTSSQMANCIPLGPLHMSLMLAVNVRSCAELKVINTDYNNRILGDATRQGRFSTRTCTGRPEFLHCAYPTPTPTVYFITKAKRFVFFIGGGRCVHGGSVRRPCSDSVLCGTSVAVIKLCYSFLQCLPQHRSKYSCSALYHCMVHVFTV